MNHKAVAMPLAIDAQLVVKGALRRDEVRQGDAMRHDPRIGIGGELPHDVPAGLAAWPQALLGAASA
jgi:hypothetical protein